MCRTLWQQCLAVILLLGGWLLAKQPAEKHAKNEEVSDRRKLTPGLVLNTTGRQGPCDVLAFVRAETGDGWSLMAAGDDKVVRFWKVNGAIDSQSMKLLRWPIYREQRGAIHAAALSPDGKQVVVCGHGVVNSAVAVLERSTGHVRKWVTLPTDRLLFAAAFAPDGKHVALGAEDGAVWLWDLHGAGKEAVRQLLPGDTKRPADNRACIVAFLDEARVLAVTQDGRVREVNVRHHDGQAHEHARFKSRHLFRAALSADHRWLAAATYEPDNPVAEVELLSLADQRHEILKAPRRDCVPTCLAWDPKASRLAVGMQHMDLAAHFPKVLGGRIYVYDLHHLQAPAVEMERHYYPEALAFHPEKPHLLASAGGDNHEIYLWDLLQPAKPISTVRGPGSSLWGVGLSADNRYLAFQEEREANPKSLNDRGTGPWRVFDLKHPRFLPHPLLGFKPVAPIESLAGWHVEPDPKDGFNWYIRHGDSGRRWALNKSGYNKAKYDIPRCYTFLKSAGRSPSLAIGHYWGISVFDLDPEHGPRLVRRMDGHEGEVMAVAPSADGKNLVSASRDQTIAGWALEGWNHGHELGTSFRGNGHLLVDQVDLFSPGWEAGLAPDDRILLALMPNGRYYVDSERKLDLAKPTLLDGRPIDGRGALQQQVSRKEALEYLHHPLPGLTITFEWQTPDRRVKAELTTVRQRPLWKFFPTRGGEWVLFRWRDYFYDCSPHGDKYVGWQENANAFKDPDQTPHFYPLERYSERFHRPDKVTEGLHAFATDPKNAFTKAFAEIEAPEVSIRVDNPKPNNVDVNVFITIKPRRNDKDQQIDRVILWRDDYRVPFTPPANNVYNEFKVKVPKEDLRRGLNRFKVVAYNAALGRGEDTVTADFTDPKRRQRRLFALCVGINDYSKVENAPNLDGCVNDAIALKGMIEKQAAMYSIDSVTLLKDRAATARSILGHIKKIEETAHPDDLFVLFLAGHGAAPVLANGQTDPHNWFFVCTDSSRRPGKEDTRLGSKPLHDALGSIKCRKLVLLDACHSGSVVKQCDPARVLTKNGMPLLILAACQVDETATEDAGHGIFTLSLLGAVEHGTGANTKDRAVLDAHELVNHLEQDVPLRCKKTGNEAQHPVFFPERPDPVPLFHILKSPDRGEKSTRKSHATTSR